MSAPRPIGYWLKLLDKLIDERFDQILTEHNITRRQWQLLSVLARADATLDHLDNAIAPFLAPDGLESSESHLAQLVENRWVTEKAAGYSMTGVGRTTFSQLAAIVQHNRDSTTEGIDASEYAATLDVLERMAHNLGWNS